MIGETDCLLVSCCCCYKSPQAQWRETTHIYHPAVLEVRRLKRIPRAGSFQRLWGRISFLAGVFQLLAAACVPWLMAPSSISEASNAATCFTSSLRSSVTQSSLPPSYKVPYDYIGSVPIIQDHLPNSSLNLITSAYNLVTSPYEAIYSYYIR